MNDTVTTFIEAMRAGGVDPAEDIAARLVDASGPIYFDCAGDKPKSRKGWAVLHLDGKPAGAFGHFKSEISQRWRSSEPMPKADPSERLRRRLEVEAAKRKREAEQLAGWETVAASQLADWAKAVPADQAHAYLKAKGIVGEGLRQCGDVLLVPMFGDQGTLWNIQRIWPNGRKLYAKGARQKGLSLILGEPVNRVVVAEGYGTGAVIRRATGMPVAVAFSWSNLTAVASQLRQRDPDLEIIIAADDDAHLVDHPKINRNVGVEAAQEAARAVGGRVAIPPRRAPHNG